MPMVGGIAAIAGGLANIDDPSAAAALTEVEHGEAAQISAARRLIRKVRSQRSGHSASPSPIGAASNRPALLTTTSIRPSSAAIASHQSAVAASGLARSAAMRPSPPALEWPTTRWPFSASTIDAPMPRLAPVTRIWRGSDMARRISRAWP